MKRIHIVGDNGSEQAKVIFEVFEPLKKKKLTSTWFPTLYGASTFNKKGDEALRFYGLLEGDEFDNYYSLRGAIAERIVVKALQSKGYHVQTFKDNFDAFLYTKEGDNVLYKYFGGLPDIVYETQDGKRFLIEVKSKDLEKKQYVEKNPPETEIMQGKMLAFLYGLDSVRMTYVLFSDDAIRKMYLSLPSPFNLENALKDFDSKMPTLTLNKDYEIIVKDYHISKPELLEQMKTAYKYADGFRQTLTLLASDISKDVFSQIFETEKKLEEDFKQ